jgi:hypothetical protein
LSKFKPKKITFPWALGQQDRFGFLQKKNTQNFQIRSKIIGTWTEIMELHLSNSVSQHKNQGTYH